MPRPPRGYDEVEIQRGLTEVALCAGNYSEAARRLKEHGRAIPAPTLRSWVIELHTDRYERIREEAVDKVYARIAEEAEAIVQAEAKVESKLTARLDAEADNLAARDLPGAIRNVATARGIGMTHSTNLRGRPSSIVEHRADPQTIFDKLADKYPDSVIDSTAEEIKEDKKALPSSSVG